MVHVRAAQANSQNSIDQYKLTGDLPRGLQQLLKGSSMWLLML
jgi:hypothetical protein